MAATYVMCRRSRLATSSMNAVTFGERWSTCFQFGLDVLCEAVAAMIARNLPQ